MYLARLWVMYSAAVRYLCGVVSEGVGRGMGGKIKTKISCWRKKSRSSMSDRTMSCVMPSLIVCPGWSISLSPHEIMITCR